MLERLWSFIISINYIIVIFNSYIDYNIKNIEYLNLKKTFLNKYYLFENSMNIDKKLTLISS